MSTSTDEMWKRDEAHIREAMARQAASAGAPSKSAGPVSSLGVVGGSSQASSAEALLAHYEAELSRLIASHDGISRAIFRTQAKVEVARELIGLPVLTKKRGRPRRQDAFTTERQPDSNVEISHDPERKTKK